MENSNILIQIKKDIEEQKRKLTEDLEINEKKINIDELLLNDLRNELEQFKSEIEIVENSIHPTDKNETKIDKSKKINKLWNMKGFVLEAITNLEKNRNELLRLKLSYRSELGRLTVTMTKYMYDDNKKVDDEVNISTALANLFNNQKSVSNKKSDDLEIMLESDLSELESEEKYNLM